MEAQTQLDRDLLDAVEHGEIERIEALVMAGAHIECLSRLDGWTPLMIATSRGDVNTATLLVASGANLETRGENDETALHKAAMEGRPEAAQFLIDGGADVEAVDSSNKSALFWATVTGATKVASVLLRAHASVNSTANNLQNSLHEACYRGRHEIVRLLLEAGADSSGKRNQDGHTPLFLLLKEDNISTSHAYKCAYWLFNYGADIDDASDEILNYRYASVRLRVLNQCMKKWKWQRTLCEPLTLEMGVRLKCRLAEIERRALAQFAS